jgi:primosomal protein N' (replication factor Y) (superfamily II helicase)
MMKYADIILPLNINQAYTFGIPLEWQGLLKVGCRVEVQFGAKKVYSGIVKRIHDENPALYQVKPIRSILDEKPIVTETQLRFWEWMASYYMCSEGDVMNAALPAHLKLVSETYVALNMDAEPDTQSLSDDEFLLIEALQVKQSKQKKSENSV